MLTWLARKLKHRLTKEDIVPMVSILALAKEKLPPEDLLSLAQEKLSVADLVHLLAKREGFAGFIAWRSEAGQAEEKWQWAAAGLPDPELLYQLEQAAISVTVRMRGPAPAA